MCGLWDLPSIFQRIQSKSNPNQTVAPQESWNCYHSLNYEKVTGFQIESLTKQLYNIIKSCRD